MNRPTLLFVEPSSFENLPGASLKGLLVELEEILPARFKGQLYTLEGRCFHGSEAPFYRGLEDGWSTPPMYFCPVLPLHQNVQYASADPAGKTRGQT